MSNDTKVALKKKIVGVNPNIPSQTFNVNLVNGTTKEPRQLSVGGDGLKLINGPTQEWEKPPITVFRFFFFFLYYIYQVFLQMILKERVLL
jgi:hypothetical protein